MQKVFTSCKSFGWKNALSTTGWLLGYFIFLVLGAFLFWKIESPKDLDIKNNARDVFLERLKFYNISPDNSMIRDLVNIAIAANDVGGLDLNNYTNPVETWWTLGGSFFFASTIVTTIGYGNIAPTSHGGRSFTIFYALIGIPFTGIVLAKVGRGLSNIIKRADNFIEARIKQCFSKLAEREDTKKYVRLTQLLFVITVFVIFFWIIPAVCMTYTEKWSFSDAAYFCFISLTTIGLGDIVPGASDGLTFSGKIQLAQVRKGAYQVSIILYLILGLAALTIILNLIGSLIKNVAETTLKHGKNTMLTAGNKISGAGGKIAETGGRFFDGVGHGGQMLANSMRKKFSRLNSASDPPTPSSSRNSPEKQSAAVIHRASNSRLSSLSETQEVDIEGSEQDATPSPEHWSERELREVKDSAGSLNENFVKVSFDPNSPSSLPEMPKPAAC